ncbi:WD40 repeat protein [Winogradskyella epiphytica]|uniref:WD40 repeat protein n=1 Tax=Winogradskyella epiphytica TaxID=262005 RepID=A0A2V4XEB5_9FLAO|nr:PD40 domain-containing protein [Winogradskyella epiphytica]PYE81095.1 WD40 repeat protein [Winogradskyella epiphytica]GGW66828.1 hypothetical protein GCM10008085_18380 [Winogradskyella epiphytica]
MKLVLPFLLLSAFSFCQEFEIRNLKINDKYDHFAVRKVGDIVFFSTNLLTRRGNPIRDRFQQELYGVYEAKVDEHGEIYDAKLINRTDTSKFNMSVTAFSNDGKYMYYTSNNTVKGYNNLADYDTFNLVIQRAEYVEGRGWTNFTTLPFCDPDFNFAHPALSPDGSTLYFIADVEGTKGKSDLYKVSVTDHRSYGELERLNDSINSPRTETYPFVSIDNKLYFASDRRGGKGGIDIYVYDLESDDKDQVAISLPEPINNIGDDFSFYLNDDLDSGYVSSRRLRGNGRDDLYYFTGFKSLDLTD